MAGDCVIKRRQDVSGSWDETVVVNNHPEEFLHAFDGGGAREIGDDGDFGLKRADAIGVDLVAKELDRGDTKNTLGRADDEAVVLKEL